MSLNAQCKYPSRRSYVLEVRSDAKPMNELGMEEIYEFEVKDMPVTVAVDPPGHSIHKTRPTEWRAKIARTSVLAH